MAQTAAITTARPFVAVSQAAQRPRGRLVTCSAVQQQQQQEAAQQQQLARRSLLAGLALLATAAPSRPSSATVGRWDGESSAIGSCKLGDAGAECREQILLKDKQSFASYESTANEAGKVAAPISSGVPVAEMGDKYSRETVALTDKILAYAGFADPSDPGRLQVIKELKAEMPVWVSKYARGGSARKASARKVYIVIDAISGHLASNGLGPMPRFKLQKLVADLEEARQLLAEGK